MKLLTFSTDPDEILGVEVECLLPVVELCPACGWHDRHEVAVFTFFVWKN